MSPLGVVSGEQDLRQGLLMGSRAGSGLSVTRSIPQCPITRKWEALVMDQSQEILLQERGGFGPRPPVHSRQHRRAVERSGNRALLPS